MRTFELTPIEYEKIHNVFHDYECENNGEYICFCAKLEGCTITVYLNKKGRYKATFVGNDADQIIDSLNLSNEIIKEKKEKIEKNWICLTDQIGSDEVGTGDSFLPCVVVASYVKVDDIPFLNKLGIDDSKKINDERILEIGDTLVEHFKNRFSKLTLSNDKYNEMYTRGENINSLKARLHNQVLYNLKIKNLNVNNIFVDQFCKPELYYRYLNKDINIVDNITFRTKGESFYPSVAVASVIARYSFLLVKEKLESRYGMEFPFGSNGKADEFGKLFISKFGKNEYKKIAKLNFKNVRDLVN